jgi:hypothetical protein
MGIIVAFDITRYCIYDAAKEAKCLCTFSEPEGYEGCPRILAAQV